MKNVAISLAGWIGLLLSASLSHAIEVTVYNQNLGLIKETREFELKKGQTTLHVTDIPSQIDSTSVHFKSLTDPAGTTVMEQNFQYDLISQEKLLQKYIGKEIQFESYRGVNGDKREVIKGILLSTLGGRVIKVGNQLVLNPAGNPILPELPEGLVTQPTLLWQIQARKPGPHSCELTYMTGGMSWQADYIVNTNASDDKMDLNAWVTLDNTSGAAYKNATLKLVAGDINRVQDQFRKVKKNEALEIDRLMAASAVAFSEKSFFEYHLYTLGHPTTLMNNETKQIELIQASNIPLKKKFVYDGVTGIQWGQYTDYYRMDSNYGINADKKVDVSLEFKNSKENNLGIPLPKGRIRVYKKDDEGSSQFVGEDAIDHTAKDERVCITMGQAFDLAGERKRTDFSIDNDKKTFRETFEIRLRNHKNEPITINTIEHLYRWTNWKIVESSQAYKKKDAQTIEFENIIPKDGETVISYTVKYWW